MMAKAIASVSEEYEEHFYKDDESDEELYKQNGAVNKLTDRYGFIGGDQYTDPNTWVFWFHVTVELICTCGRDDSNVGLAIA